MRFCEFLKLLNCYIGQEKSQYDFMYFLFSLIVCVPFSEEEMNKDEMDEYYPFSKLCSESLAKKIYIGDRAMGKPLARFAHSHFQPSGLQGYIEDMNDEIKENLCKDFQSRGVESNLDDIADVVSNLFHQFILAAIDEKDEIETQIKAKSVITVQGMKATNYDVLLLEETANSCALCGNRLLYLKGNDVIKKYKAVQIFPNNLSRDDFLIFNKAGSLHGSYESPENLILLCTNCALDYESDTTLEKFSKLMKIKKSFMERNILRESLEAVSVEDEIGFVINALISSAKEENFVTLSLDALCVEQKIEAKYGVLIHSISDDVVRYYKFIEEQFRIANSYQSNTFERIAGEVRLAYEKLEGNNLSQDQIYDEMIEWMMRALNFQNRHRQAVGIIISFFVQNCEVFHELSK